MRSVAGNAEFQLGSGGSRISGNSGERRLNLSSRMFGTLSAYGTLVQP